MHSTSWHTASPVGQLAAFWIIAMTLTRLQQHMYDSGLTAVMLIS